MVKFPSLQALRSFFSSHLAPGTGPELDERFVMSSNHAARVLRRQVSKKELEGEAHQENFWLVKPFLHAKRAHSSLKEELQNLVPKESTPGTLYKGDEIPNLVEWCLDGSEQEVYNSYKQSIGHHRLWHYANGKLLDLSPWLGPEKTIFTTATEGTFYQTITYKDSWVTLVFDGREGWKYGFINRYGTFEFKHMVNELEYLKEAKNWKELPCFGDYGSTGLCPADLEAIRMGTPPAREACQLLSDYRGEGPVPPEVCEACAIFVTYTSEGLKMDRAFDVTAPSLLGFEFSLGLCTPSWPLMVKRWSRMGYAKITYCIRMLNNSEEIIMPKHRPVPGINSAGDLMSTVAIIPYNKIPGSEGNTRDWTAYPLNSAALLSDGQPHKLSSTFARRWPYNYELATYRPPNKMIHLAEVLPHVKDFRRGYSSAALGALKTLRTIPK